MNSSWYFLELQRQFVAEECPPSEQPLEPMLRPRMSVKEGLIELGVPLFVLAVLVTFGVVCFFYPTFVS